jgi:Trk K+ transport system NAD-binding subunit
MLSSLPRSYRRLLALIASVPVLLFLLGVGYRFGMVHLEGIDRSLADSVAWAAETLTTTGYGRDESWTHPAMQGYVMLVQFLGVFFLFLIFPIFFIPFIEERFEARLARRLPDLSGEVLIYHSGPAVTSFVADLAREGVPVVFFEEDEATARRLRERHPYVVLGDLREEEPDLRNLSDARGIILNGEDDQNAAMALGARAQGYEGPIIAMVRNPERRPPLLRAGATAAFTPGHLLAAALASRASNRIGPRVAGIHHLGLHLDVAELRVDPGSPLIGQSIAEARIRETTGATLVALWESGELIPQPTPEMRFRSGTVLIGVGPEAGLALLGKLAVPVPRSGAFVVIGAGDVGVKVAEFLLDAGERVIIVGPEAQPGVDVVGDHLSFDVLMRAGIREAQGIIIALEDDSASLFAVAVVRNLAPEKMIFVAARRVENISRIHRAGADFALSVSQVAGKLLSFHLLGKESVDLEVEVTLVAAAAGTLAGKPLVTKRIREETGCAVVAIERGEDVIVEFHGGFEILPDDVLYLSGSHEAVAKFFKTYPGSKR